MITKCGEALCPGRGVLAMLWCDVHAMHDVHSMAGLFPPSELSMLGAAQQARSPPCCRHLQLAYNRTPAIPGLSRRSA